MHRIGSAPLIAFLVALACVPVELRSETLEFATVACDPPIQAGARIRVRAPSAWLSGHAAAASGDTLRVALGPFGLSRTVVLSPASTLQLRAGPQPRTWGAVKGAGMGALMGILLGVGIRIAFKGEAKDDAMIAGVLLPYTIPIGAVVGAVLPGERWDSVHLEARP
jgi:hypothetical protein